MIFHRRPRTSNRSTRGVSGKRADRESKGWYRTRARILAAATKIGVVMLVNITEEGKTKGEEKTMKGERENVNYLVEIQNSLAQG